MTSPSAVNSKAPRVSRAKTKPFFKVTGARAESIESAAKISAARHGSHADLPRAAPRTGVDLLRGHEHPAPVRAPAQDLVQDLRGHGRANVVPPEKGRAENRRRYSRANLLMYRSRGRIESRAETPRGVDSSWPKVTHGKR